MKIRQYMWKLRTVIDRPTSLDIAELFCYNENLTKQHPLDEKPFNLKIWSCKIYFLMILCPKISSKNGKKKKFMLFQISF